MASVTEASNVVGGTRNDAIRKYPPLLAIFVAMAIVLAVLPSALNLPQSNPTQTLEYAPVPPDDNSDTPPQGNMSSLGLGSSSGIDGSGAQGGDGEGGGPLDDDPETPASEPPPGSEFRCVGENPPRQTNDPLAPPCVPFFDGDNGGTTYQGVEPDEIRILIYMDGGINYINASDPTRRSAPRNKYFDLWVDPKEPDHLTVAGFRTWQRYFNLRFQRYNRRVHFHVYFTDSGPTSDSRRQNAADNFEQVKPFAVVSFATEGFEDEYLKAMARKGVLNFGSFGLRPAEFFNAFPKMIWSYLPSIEQQTDSFVNYICTKAAYPGARAMNAGGPLKDQPRKFGIIYTTDPKQAGLRLAAKIVQDRVAKQCGLKFDAFGPFPSCCLAQDNGEVPEYASQQMAEFKRDGITTIVWPGGINGNYGKSAKGIDYEPEWLIMGDGLLDGFGAVTLSQNSPAFDKRAIVVTPQPLQPSRTEQQCWKAYREVNQSTPDGDLAYICRFYPNLFQLFVGIQVAGPRLGPTSIDKGFHAIPQRKTSTDPTVPACFYLPGDYTCIKDTAAMAWTADEQPPGENTPGCWRVIQGGARYLPDQWREQKGDMFANIFQPGDVCNGYSRGARYNLA